MATKSWAAVASSERCETDAVSILKKKPRNFEMQVHDMVLRVTAPQEYLEESRAAALHFWDQLQAYAARNHEFGASKRPVELPEEAPAAMREVAAVAALAGVGPKFTFEGAITDHVGRLLARRVGEVAVAGPGDYFVVTRKRTKLTVFRGEDEADDMAIAIDPKRGPVGVFTTTGKRKLPVESVDGLAVIASSCALADAAGTYALGVLAKPDSMKKALDYLQRVEGVRGAIVLRDGAIGVAGAVEIAA